MPGDLFPDRIETESLVFEPLTAEHVDVFEFYDICSSDPGIGEVTENLTWSPHETVKETHEFLESVAHRIENAAGIDYVVRPAGGENGAGDIAGATAVKIDWDRRTATLGMWLRKPFWGRGYSGERAAAMMELAFDRLDLDAVTAAHEDGNEQSRRAIEKYVDRHGGRYEGKFRNLVAMSVETSADSAPARPADLHRYTITQSEYRASK